MNKLIIFILVIGILYRLSLTSNGNFLFNMDNARDFVDVREMVVLHKLRLTGPTSAIEGLYNGPVWYYLLAIPFLISGGDPYSGILMEIVLWAIGGFFLLKLASRFGKLAVFGVGFLWVASNYIVLTSLYTFNPNPVLFLTPLLIFLIDKYINTEKFTFIFLAFFLGGLIFNFEMNAGIFTPLVIFFSILFCKKRLLKSRIFWVSLSGFLITLAPQILFDLKHEFIMSKSVINFLSQPKVLTYNPLQRVFAIYQSFESVLSATLMNQKILTQISMILFFVYFTKLIIRKLKSTTPLEIISTLVILVPFLGYIILPVQVNPWHLGAPVVASVLLLNIILSKFRFNFFSKVISLGMVFLIIYFALANIINFYTHDRFIQNQDPSEFVNEIAAIDYVYKYANGQNFKVYTYLPSVYDYPYQYLFWWYGRKVYGYIPGEYVYSPNKPQYIPSQDKFQGRKDNFSGLVFLIKEPDRIKMRQAWENDFKNMEFISKKIVGPIEIEIKKEL